MPNLFHFSSPEWSFSMALLTLALFSLICLAFESTEKTGITGMLLLFIINPKFMAALLLWSVLSHFFYHNNT